MTWVNPAIDAINGFGSFMGNMMPILIWIAFIAFVGFTLVILVKRFVGTVS